MICLFRPNIASQYFKKANDTHQKAASQSSKISLNFASKHSKTIDDLYTKQLLISNIKEFQCVIFIYQENKLTVIVENVYPVVLGALRMYQPFLIQIASGTILLEHQKMRIVLKCPVDIQKKMLSF